MNTQEMIDEHYQKILDNYINFYRKLKVKDLKRDLLELQKTLSFYPTMPNKLKYQAIRQVIREKQNVH